MKRIPRLLLLVFTLLALGGSSSAPTIRVDSAPKRPVDERARLITFKNEPIAAVTGPLFIVTRGLHENVCYASSSVGPASLLNSLKMTTCLRPVSSGGCCITCESRTVCANSVVTTCGSCDGGGGGGGGGEIAY